MFLVPYLIETVLSICFGINLHLHNDWIRSSYVTIHVETPLHFPCSSLLHSLSQYWVSNRVCLWRNSSHAPLLCRETNHCLAWTQYPEVGISYERRVLALLLHLPVFRPSLCYHWVKPICVMSVDWLISNQKTELFRCCTASQSQHRIWSLSEYGLEDKKQGCDLTEVTVGCVLLWCGVSLMVRHTCFKWGRMLCIVSMNLCRGV